MHVPTVNCFVRTSKIQVSPSLSKPTFQSRRTTVVTQTPYLSAKAVSHNSFLKVCLVCSMVLLSMGLSLLR